MKKLVLKVLVVAIALISLSNCGGSRVKNEIVFKKGVNLELYYKDSKGIEFTTLITLVDEKDETSVFTGVVHGKTVYDSFPIGGVIDYFEFRSLKEISITINGLSMGKKTILNMTKNIFLREDSVGNYKKTYKDNDPYMEIRAIKQNRLST